MPKQSPVGATNVAANMSEVDWAYLAGRVDADGSIGCYKHSRPVYIAVRLDLYSNHLEYLESVKEALGGWISKNNTTWQWCCGTSEVVEVLTNLLPYLRTKKEQAELAIKCRLHGKKTEEEYDWYCIESKRLNGRYSNRA